MCALLALALVRGAHAQLPDLTWIAQVPGLKLVSQAGGINTYSVVGNPDAAFNNVRAGMRQRGWDVSQGHRMDDPGPQARQLLAFRTDGWKADVNLLPDTSRGAVITVNMTRNAYGQPATPPPVPVGKDIIIGANKVTQAIDSANSSVIINGNNCNIVLRGQVHDLIVNGNNNRIQAAATTQTILVKGNNNLVRWSDAGNARAPQVLNSGKSNDISKY